MRPLTLPLVLLATVSSLAASSCVPSPLPLYEFPSTPLSHINGFLSRDAAYTALAQKGCAPDRSAHAVCFNKPAIGSGLAQLWPRYFLGLTDRGPTQKCKSLAKQPGQYPAAAGKKGKGFVVPRYAPAIVHFSVDGAALTQRRAVPLRGDDGEAVSGIPNTGEDDLPYGPDCGGEPLEFDPSGLDPEDVARVPGTDYVAIADEYGPSVVIANFKTGRIAARHVPAKKAALLKKATYKIVGDMPDVYALRRKNHGFESVVVDKDGKYVIAILQNTMLGEDEKKTEMNNIIRCAYFKMSVDGKGVPQLKYKRSFILEASSPDAYAEPPKPEKVKYSGAQWAAEGKFYALERVKGQVKLFLVDWSKATDIDKTKYADGLDLETETNGERKAEELGVTPATKKLVWDSHPAMSGPLKLEGFAVDMNDPTKVWLIEDNDYGKDGNPNTRLYRVSMKRSGESGTTKEAVEAPAEEDD